MNNYTLEDIRNFINNMEKNYLVRMKDILKNIPFIGVELYKKALFEQMKIDFCKRALEEAEKGTIEEQQKLIREFTPILLEVKSKKRIKLK